MRREGAGFILVSAGLILAFLAGRGDDVFAAQRGDSGRSLHDLVSKSAVICIGKIKKVGDTGRMETKDSCFLRTKTAEVEVLESFKGARKGESLRLLFFERDGTMDVFPGGPRTLPLSAGESGYLMFLAPSRDPAGQGSYQPASSPNDEESLIELNRKSLSYMRLKWRRDARQKLNEVGGDNASDPVELFDRVDSMMKEDGTLSEEEVKKFRKYCEELPEEVKKAEAAREALVEYCRENPKAFKVEGLGEKTEGATPVMTGPKTYKIGPFVVDVEKKTYSFTQHTVKEGGGLAVKWEYAGRFTSRAGGKWKAGAPALKGKSGK